MHRLQTQLKDEAHLAILALYGIPVITVKGSLGESKLPFNHPILVFKQQQPDHVSQRPVINAG
jgi:hypothetical protein